MIVGVLSLRLHIPGAHSLKDRRRALRSVKDTLRTQFNVSVAELAEDDVWQTADLGVAAIGADRAYVEGLLDRVAALARSSRHVEVMRCEKDFV